MQGILEMVEASECDQVDGQDPTKCNFPIFKEYTGFEGATDMLYYDCGECAIAGDVGVTCQECDVTDPATPCNVINVGEDFQCYTFTYNGETQLWDREQDKTVCKRLQGTEAKCNSPADGTADSDWSSTGCGPCETDDGNCITCEGDSCNSVIYGTPHFCFNYEWDQEAPGGGKFEVQEEKTDCRRVAGDEVNCNSPKKEAGEEDWMSDGCGLCDTGSEDVCETCTGDSCNSVPYTVSYQCHTFTYNEELTEFKKEQEETMDCVLEPGKKKLCNSPRKGAGMGDYTSDGCGPCETHNPHTMSHEMSEHGSYCKECEGELCNISGATLTGVSMLVVSILQLVIVL